MSIKYIALYENNDFDDDDNIEIKKSLIANYPDENMLEFNKKIINYFDVIPNYFNKYKIKDGHNRFYFFSVCYDYIVCFIATKDFPKIKLLQPEIIKMDTIILLSKQIIK